MIFNHIELFNLAHANVFTCHFLCFSRQNLTENIDQSKTTTNIGNNDT